MTEDAFERVRDRARELQAAGFEQQRAHGTAWLEERIRLWPSGWGDDFHILLYGDFDPPQSTLDYPSLGIVIHSERVSSSSITGASTVLKATVKIEGKSVPALIEAAKRINLFLGTYTLLTWGSTPCSWWSWVTHDSSSACSVVNSLGQADVELLAAKVKELPAKVRNKVEAAMFWIREPRNMVKGSYRIDTLRVYSAYWNAFECLVGAVNELKPCTKSSAGERQEQVNQFLEDHGGKLTIEQVKDCHRIVAPGLVASASHALEMCFQSDGRKIAEECFRAKPEDDRLYQIRNDINHGNIDAENPEELVRVDAKLKRLKFIVWMMFKHVIHSAKRSGTA